MGIPNLGNTCYVATCLQCLRVCQSFVAYLESARQPLAKMLVGFYKVLQDSPWDVKVLSTTRELYDALLHGEGGGDQGDVHECMLKILDTLSKDPLAGRAPTPAPTRVSRLVLDDLARSVASHMDAWWKPHSVLDTLFEGQLAHLSACSECSNIRLTSDTFTCLSLGTQDVRSGLAQTMSADTIECECDKCKKNTTQKRATRIYRCPPILILLFDGGKGKSVPLTLDVRSYVWDIIDERKTITYSLRSAACHFGSLTYGHYVAVCKEGVQGWVAHNDTVSSAVEDDKLTLLLSHAYLVVYERA